ncbi:hypothetical protein SASPL_125899 [Salvia splendens]|uniref:Uncharacterized protein n=1 Tax=Salvia splendens TaxID=180675 RepID=A0A8X8XJS2_SALSN|nr:hypothetical protein SASPL_125899 [Salvia splendens]
MLAAKPAMHGKISCVTKLIEAGAYILMFDSVNGRTCLNHAAYYGHSDCVEVILSAARSSQVAASWGYSRFVNVRDHKGATPLHLALNVFTYCCKMKLLFALQLLDTASLEVLFIWLHEVVLLIAYESCSLGALIAFKETPQGASSSFFDFAK